MSCLPTTLPPRRISSPNKSSKQFASPLQILLQMGFPRHRALKALAATGNRSVQLASDWLLTHVNDATLDEERPREYILYACPAGPLLSRLHHFWAQSKETCGWNGAHNYAPHITLVSFFKAPDDCSLQLAKCLKQATECAGPPPDNFLKLEPYISHNFMGLFVSDEHADYLKGITMQYVKRVSTSIGLKVDTYEHLDALATCFPWCAVPQEQTEPSICLEPHVKSLHMTLAHQFPVNSYATLKSLVDELQPLETACWELRLYSRDPRLFTMQVHKVLKEFIAREPDELELVMDDYVYLDETAVCNSKDGWIQGTSWLTGNSGYLPIVYTERTAESDAWTLHKAMSLTTDSLDSKASLKSSDTDTASELDAKPEQTTKCALGGEVELGRAQTQVSFQEWRDRYRTFRMDTFVNVLDEDASKASTDVDEVDSSTLPQISQVQASDLPSGVASDEAVQGTPAREEPGGGGPWLLTVRHGERVDLTYGKWVPFCFDSEGNYTRLDLNMPPSLPVRTGGAEAYEHDCPLTLVGQYQAQLVGEGLREAGVTLQRVYSSPALRCIQTANSLLRGLNAPEGLQIKVEPGLYEWLAFYQTSQQWMSPPELHTAGYSIDLSYTPQISVNEAPFAHSTKTNTESFAQFSKRNQDVIKNIVKQSENTGDNILLVGHACTAFMARDSLSSKASVTEDFTLLREAMACTPYVALSALRARPWRLVPPPCPPLMLTSTGRFDWKIVKQIE